MPKKTKKYYFGEREQQAVLDYIKTNCPKEKEKIYNKYLKTPFRIMRESILRKWTIKTGTYDMEEIEHDALTHLIENLHKFNPDAPTKSGNKTKAYSYYQTIIRNFYRDHGKNAYKNEKTNLNYDDFCDEIQNNNEHSYEINDKDQSTQITRLIEHIVEEIKRTMVRDELNENELAVGNAIIYIFENWEILFLENTPKGRYNALISNKYEKNKILLYIKEYTRLSTKEIRDALKIYKDLYFLKKNRFIEKENE